MKLLDIMLKLPALDLPNVSKWGKLCHPCIQWESHQALTERCLCRASTTLAASSGRAWQIQPSLRLPTHRVKLLTQTSHHV